jgi:hypothetical protein
MGDSEVHFYHVFALPINSALLKAAPLTEETQSEPEYKPSHEDIIGDFARHYEEEKGDRNSVIDEVDEERSESDEEETQE